MAATQPDLWRLHTSSCSFLAFRASPTKAETAAAFGRRLKTSNFVSRSVGRRATASWTLRWRGGSEAAKADWIRERLVIASEELEQAWIWLRQALEEACERGDLLKLRISGADWYPAAFATLSCDDVRDVCNTHRGLDRISAFIFRHIKHGSLRGLTLHEALRRGERQAVIHLAQGFASQELGTTVDPPRQDVATT